MQPKSVSVFGRGDFVGTQHVLSVRDGGIIRGQRTGDDLLIELQVDVVSKECKGFIVKVSLETVFVQ